MLTFTLNSVMQILAALTALFFGIFLYVMYIWSGLQPDDPKSFKASLFTTILHTFKFFVYGVIILSMVYVIFEFLRMLGIRMPFIGL